MHSVIDNFTAELASSKVAQGLAHHMPFGAELAPPSAVRFSLWAPAAEKISLEIEGESEQIPLRKSEDGWHEVVTPRAGNGSRYRFVLPDGKRVPDPASALSARGRPWSQRGN